MNSYSNKLNQKNEAVAENLVDPGNKSASVLQDNRPEAAVQRKLQTEIGQIQSASIPKKTNQTGLPDALKSGIENLSGLAMDDVKVHYNSDKPAQLHAHAYAQGTHIHLASGQEKHLPHEAWHVVQQKQGRVKPTLQLKGKVNVNDNDGLEKEADAMGAKAKNHSFTANPGVFQKQSVQRQAVIQREWIEHTEDQVEWIPARSGLKWFYNTKTKNMRFEPEKGADIGELEKLIGVEKSYRAWIKEWGARKYIGGDKAHNLSFAGYAANIHDIYPPEKFEYVGIGASCDLVLEYLKQKFGTPSSNIPISGLTNVENTNTEEWKLEDRKRVLNYIFAFIPKEILNGAKKILLMDVASGGNTLTVMKQLFQKLIVEYHGNPNNVTCLSLNGAMNPENEFYASNEPAATSEPVEPKNVTLRKPTAEEIAKGRVASGTALDRDVDFVIASKIEKLQKKLIGKELDQETRQKIEKRIARNEKLRYEYYPILYDRLLTDTADRKDQKSIEAKLDSQDYKKLGRTHRKVNYEDIQSGKTDARREMEEGREKNDFPAIVEKMLLDEKE